MSSTPIPDHLTHKPKEVDENARLFDAFVELIDLWAPDREILVSHLMEKIRRKVISEGEMKLPFGLVIRPVPTP
jgi:hypothetical protein